MRLTSLSLLTPATLGAGCSHGAQPVANGPGPALTRRAPGVVPGPTAPRLRGMGRQKAALNRLPPLPAPR